MSSSDGQRENNTSSDNESPNSFTAGSCGRQGGGVGGDGDFLFLCELLASNCEGGPSANPFPWCPYNGLKNMFNGVPGLGKKTFP